MEIKGKVAIVTGGASGLGEATVRQLVDSGAFVAIFDMNEAKGSALVAELGTQAIYCNVNVSDELSVTSGIAKVVEKFSAVHICVNFAGIASAAKTVGRDGAFPLDVFKKVIDVNLVGTFNVLRLAAVEMAKNEPVTDDGGRGVIINTASVAAYEGQVGQAAYSASKGGVVGMTLPIARDLASLGIRCNTIVPGLVHTPLFDSLPKEAMESLAATVLNPKRLARPDEVAHMARFIIENDYMNGECLRIDGGIRMQAR